MSQKELASTPTKLKSPRNWFAVLTALLAAASIYQVVVNGPQVVPDNPYVAGMLRFGVAMAALWLAWPDLLSNRHETPYQMFASMLILLGLITIGSQALLVFALLVFVFVLTVGSRK